MTGRKSRALAAGYCSEVDRVGEQAWNRLMPQFDDCSLNQTWAYGAVTTGERGLSHLTLRHGEEIVACAQVRIRRLPVVGCGIAYVGWGPMWRRAGREADAEDFRQAARALRNEYVCGRGLTLRLFPLDFEDDKYALRAILSGEGFLPAKRKTGDRTLLLDLSHEIPALFSGLEHGWRRCLRRSKEKGLDIVEGTQEHLLDEFIGIYKQMLVRKGFAPSDFTRIKPIQERLPEGLKTKVYLCREGGEPCAGLVISTMGKIGIELFAATNDLGTQNCSSYLLHWKTVQTMKQTGQSIYNLNGINPEDNPGTYRFKRGLAGKSGRDLYYLGRFDADPGIFSHTIIRLGDALRSWKRERGQRRSRPGNARGQGSRSGEATQISGDSTA